IRFDQRIEGGIVKEDKTWFMFDGEWLIEKSDKTHQVKKKQLVPAGQKIDVFKLGKGPFPMPFGQSRQDMLVHFTITRAPAAKDDPPNTDHLVATPKSGSGELERFKVLHFYIDRKLDLPVLIAGEQKPQNGDETLTRARFENVEINKG